MWKQTKPTCFYACLLFPCGWTEDFDSITNLDSVSLNYSLSTFISSRTPRAIEELCKPRQEKRSITVISFSWFAPLFLHFLCIIPSLDSGFWTAKVAEGNTMRRFCWAQMPATSVKWGESPPGWAPQRHVTFETGPRHGRSDRVEQGQ